mmetsp:Transcript_33926/g.74231  ORF Transcript_33926/g.74231 Transcript_33926/m.74231 type:complete len:212 (+) Transcript_33926:860-1495(+)
MKELEVCKVVNINLVFEDHHHPITPKPYRTNLTTKAQLSDAPALVVVPYHDLIGWVLGIATTSSKGQYVTPEKHLHLPYPTVVKLPSKRLCEGVTVVNPEPRVCAASEAAIVLVEAYREHLYILRLRHFSLATHNASITPNNPTRDRPLEKLSTASERASASVPFVNPIPARVRGEVSGEVKWQSSELVKAFARMPVPVFGKRRMDVTEDC